MSWANVVALFFLGLAVGLIVTSLWLATLMIKQTRSLEKSLQAALTSCQGAPVANDIAPELSQICRPFEKLRIFLAIEQDHPSGILAEMLKERLLVADASDVSILSADGSPNAATLGDNADLLITGRVVCNGYFEIYYKAEISCFNQRESIWALSENPPGGDRQSNLALEIVTRLGERLQELTARAERRQAIKELRS